ncbi:S26 family signal peptidase [Sphingobium sp. B12D2B]|uniref:S26 family signal peptidase n=1 Tax=Sphingobium sp. B12D2B TaxID=2940577 RepID=UPI0022256321|nr:S26 family signal peptidase [Sphingobium sp. B12D2B]MCW2351783.1 conjugal transfer pilin signal peptidase TrbI [Sphingobium sp. B12D2B]
MATAANNAAPVRCRPRKQLWAALLMVVIGTTCLSAISAWRDDHLLLINATNSLPNWAFVIHRQQLPRRGQFVFFDPPHGDLVRRHFGAKPRMFGKLVYGMPGDVVAHQGEVVLINGRAVGRMKPNTRSGEPLTMGAVGAIPTGCYYAGSPHPDGLDSRYAEIGFICARQIIGVGEAIL